MSLLLPEIVDSLTIQRAVIHLLHGRETEPDFFAPLTDDVIVVSTRSIAREPTRGRLCCSSFSELGATIDTAR